MVYRRRRMYKRKPVSTKRKVLRKAIRKQSNQNISKVVKKVVGRMAETKVVQYGGSLVVRTLQGAVSQAQFNASCFIVTPQGGVVSGVNQGYPIIGNGIGQDQRVGDECKIKAQYFDYLLYAEDYNATSNPTPRAQIVQIWIVKPKRQSGGDLAISNIAASTAANFFETQTDSTAGFNGFMSDTLRKVDKDNYEVVACRTHKIGFSGTLNTSDAVTTVQNNDFKQFTRGRIKIPGYTWKVNRQEGYEGQSRQMYCFVTCFNVQNLTQTPTINPVGIDFNLSTYYTDM